MLRRQRETIAETGVCGVTLYRQYCPSSVPMVRQTPDWSYPGNQAVVWGGHWRCLQKGRGLVKHERRAFATWELVGSGAILFNSFIIAYNSGNETKKSSKVSKVESF